MPDIVAKFLICSIAAGIVAILGRVAVQSQPDDRGWRHITPGAMHWTGTVLGAGLFFFMAYIWLFVGSTRSDGAAQMRILFWLTIAFGLGTMVSAFSIQAIRRDRVSWRGNIVRFAGAGGSVRVDLEQVRGLRPGFLAYAVDFQDGVRVRIDPYANGAAQLLDLINEKLATSRAEPDA
ncbi:MAG TPA: hypothetical protein PK970_06255 [Hyphomicrobiaceae bacterium]|nr:hypothetical protein [Hyphomicrobiaceae bacterium]